MAANADKASKTIEGHLCPQCGGQHINIQTWVRIDYEVVLDGHQKDLEVVAEMIGDAVWDSSSPARCPVCQWSGTVADLQVTHAPA